MAAPATDKKTEILTRCASTESIVQRMNEDFANGASSLNASMNIKRYPQVWMNKMLSGILEMRYAPGFQTVSDEAFVEMALQFCVVASAAQAGIKLTRPGVDPVPPPKP
jgi:hypothetical protein